MLRKIGLQKISVIIFVFLKDNNFDGDNDIEI